MALPARFFTEVIVRDDGTEVDRELVELTHPDGTLSVREATDEDRALYIAEYTLFKEAAKAAEPEATVRGAASVAGGRSSGASKKD